MAAATPDKDIPIDVLRLWQLPDGFFDLPLAMQWEAMAKVTSKARRLSGPRDAVPMTLADEALLVAFFLLTLGTPWVLAVLGAILLVYGTWTGLLLFIGVVSALALHPLPRNSLLLRSSRLSLGLCRYFSLEILLDRSDPAAAQLATPAVDSAEFQRTHQPALYLACPHGVFNYGATAWCCISRWVSGWYQTTGGAAAVASVPGMRYMDLLIWLVKADRKNIQRELRAGGADTALHGGGADTALHGAARRGGMMGMVPDGIAGAFRSSAGVDELLIGKKRGLMRICLEEGANVYACWFFGTTECLHILKDPFGILEGISRKMQAGLLGYYGRWLLPVPHRVAITVITAVVSAPRTAEPTSEQVEALHREVYGALERVHGRQKVYAGYSDRKFQLL